MPLFFSRFPSFSFLFIFFPLLSLFFLSSSPFSFLSSPSFYLSLFLFLFLSLLQQISGIPVVDGRTGVIISALTVKDAKHIVTNPDCYRVMNRPIGHCLEHFRPPLVCRPTTAITDLLHTMAARREYHAYVVNDAMQPTRVLSLRDIIALFVREPPGYFAAEEAEEGADGDAAVPPEASAAV